jgi:hypothetical protein
MILLFNDCHENLKSNIPLCTPSSRKENIMGVLKNRVLRKIFGSTKQEVGWRKLRDEEPHNLYLNNITVHAYGQRKKQDYGQII